MSRRQAEALFDGTDTEYEDVFAVQAEGVSEFGPEVSDLLDELDEELHAGEVTALARVPRFTDRESAARAYRRAEAAVLRSLPSRVDMGEVA